MVGARSEFCLRRYRKQTLRGVGARKCAVWGRKARGLPARRLLYVIQVTDDEGNEGAAGGGEWGGVGP